MRRCLCPLLIGLLTLGSSWAMAEDILTGTPLPLWEDVPPGMRAQAGEALPTLTAYLPEPALRTGAAIVVCPGGGYGTLALDHEGEQIAQWLVREGIAAFVLRYRHAPHQHPAPLQDAQQAIRLVRSQAAAWEVDPARIGILGFSAGGHLAASAATHFELATGAETGLEAFSARPDFACLLYPVISMREPHAHAGSRRNLLGDAPDTALVESMSLELQAGARNPPTFLVHTTDDQVVDVENSILFYLALRKTEVPVELHVFETGRHGLGLGGGDAAFAAWPGMFLEWLRVRGILPPAP